MSSNDVPAPHFQDLFQKNKSNDSSASEKQQPTTDPGNPAPAPLHPPSAIIVGGSMGGCCAAIALASIGCPVTILERTPGMLPSQGAGLVIQPDMAEFLLHFKVCTSLSQLSFQSSGRQYVDKQGNVIGGDDEPQFFSAWDVLYHALRAAVPERSYRAGCAVQSIQEVDHHTADTSSKLVTPVSNEASSFSEQEEFSGKKKIKTPSTTTSSSVQVTFLQHNSGKQQKNFTADLVIGADGPGSLVRSQFLPHQRSKYQGYVAWRGVLLEKDTPENVLSFLGQKFTVYQGSNFHILCYLIPGSNGEIESGQRRVNWVWYRNWQEESLSEILTDIHGKIHGFSVPKGLLKPEIAENVKIDSKNMLPPALADMVCSTEDIFVQAIHDYLAPQLVFHDKALLIGDAGCILRPHTAAGTTKAAVNAWALSESLSVFGFQLKPALKKYNESMRALGQRLVNVGVDIGTRSQFPEKMAR